MTKSSINDLIIYDNGVCKIARVIIDGFIRYEIRPENKNYGTCTVSGIYTAIEIVKKICERERKRIEIERSNHNETTLFLRR